MRISLSKGTIQDKVMRGPMTTRRAYTANTIDIIPFGHLFGVSMMVNVILFPLVCRISLESV